MVQRLRLRASTTGGMGSKPGRGTKIPHAVQGGQKKSSVSFLCQLFIVKFCWQLVILCFVTSIPILMFGLNLLGFNFSRGYFTSLVGWPSLRHNHHLQGTCYGSGIVSIIGPLPTVTKLFWTRGWKHRD